MAGNSPLVIVPALSAIAIKYRQAGFVADEVMPRTPPLDKQEFKHLTDRMSDWITPPETDVGRTGAVNKLASAGQDGVDLATRNQGLDEPVPNQDQMNGPSESALGRATQRVMSLVELRREIRVATKFATAGNFSYGTTLQGQAQWSDYDHSNPVDAILAELDKPFMRPNVLVMGQAVYTKLRQHPKILMAVFGAVKTGGVVSREQLAALFEVDKIVVGQGWYNSAAKGQTPVKTRVWGKICAGVYLGQEGGPDSGNTWGYTAQFGSRVAGTVADPDIGLFGGVKVRAGESVLEVVAAPEFGFAFLDAVA